MKPNAVFTASLLLAASPVLHAADPVVANVVSAQRAGTKLVDVTFEVSDADSDTLAISLAISDDSGTSFTVPATAVSGDTSVAATPAPASMALVWDAAVDFNQEFNDSMVVRVIADDGAAPVPTPPPAGMALIPAGEFQMGQAGIEEPVHTVNVSAFYLDKFEVTKGLWDHVKAYAEINGYSFSNAGLGRGGFHPVHTVNWYDAVKWCNARSKKEGLTEVYYTDAGFTTVYETGEGPVIANWDADGYRLPTEAEWEKAARGTLLGKIYPWGDTITGGDANFTGSGDPNGSLFPGTTPVGAYNGTYLALGLNDRANGYGLYDIAGNVFEWCWDSYDAGWYSDGDATSSDTRGPSVPTGSRLTRGGSWNNFSLNLGCAERLSNDPVNESNIIGFRSARGL